MSYPQAYAPEYGYKYQILTKSQNERAYEHCDYATTTSDRDFLIKEHRLAYGPGFTFKAILLPKKYWKENE